MAPRVGQRRNVSIVGSNGNPLTVNSEGRADFVQHAHISNPTIHFSVSSIGGTTERYILVDISNINSFTHVNTTYVHLENLDVQVDVTANAAYRICIGFLENVDASNGDRFEVWCLSGSKKAGQTKEVFLGWYPNGPRCRSQSLLTSDISRNNSSYQTDLNLPSIFDPSTSNTPSGNGDIIVEAAVTAESIGLSLNLSYHVH